MVHSVLDNENIGGTFVAVKFVRYLFRCAHVPTHPRCALVGFDEPGPTLRWATPVTCDADLIEFYKQDQPNQYLGVRHARNCFGMMQLGGSRLILDKLIKEFGFTFPSHDVQPGLRCDMPVEDQSIFYQHQDYTHNIGSANSVTVWIPLQDTNEEQGALLVAPGTHKLGPIDNIGGIIPAEHKFDLQPCPIKFGEALIFNQKLVHQSGRNISKDVRFSVQMRVSDLGC